MRSALEKVAEAYPDRTDGFLDLLSGDYDDVVTGLYEDKNAGWGEDIYKGVSNAGGWLGKNIAQPVGKFMSDATDNQIGRNIVRPLASAVGDVAGRAYRVGSGAVQGIGGMVGKGVGYAGSAAAKGVGQLADSVGAKGLAAGSRNAAAGFQEFGNKALEGADAGLSDVFNLGGSSANNAQGKWYNDQQKIMRDSGNHGLANLTSAAAGVGQFAGEAALGGGALKGMSALGRAAGVGRLTGQAAKVMPLGRAAQTAVKATDAVGDATRAAAKVPKPVAAVASVADDAAGSVQAPKAIPLEANPAASVPVKPVSPTVSKKDLLAQATEPVQASDDVLSAVPQAPGAAQPAAGVSTLADDAASATQAPGATSVVDDAARAAQGVDDITLETPSATVPENPVSSLQQASPADDLLAQAMGETTDAAAPTQSLLGKMKQKAQGGLNAAGTAATAGGVGYAGFVGADAAGNAVQDSLNKQNPNKYAPVFASGSNEELLQRADSARGRADQLFKKIGDGTQLSPEELNMEMTAIFQEGIPALAQRAGKDPSKLYHELVQGNLTPDKAAGFLTSPPAKQVEQLLKDQKSANPQQDLFSWFQKLEPGAQLMLGIGVPLGLIGLVSSTVGQGGMGSMIAAALGIGGAAYAGGAFGNDPLGLIGGLTGMMGGTAAPEAPGAPGAGAEGAAPPGAAPAAPGADPAAPAAPGAAPAAPAAPVSPALQGPKGADGSFAPPEKQFAMAQGVLNGDMESMFQGLKFLQGPWAEMKARAAYGTAPNDPKILKAIADAKAEAQATIDRLRGAGFVPTAG